MAQNSVRFAKHTAFVFRVGSVHPEYGGSMFLEVLITTYKIVLCKNLEDSLKSSKTPEVV
jgi:hypothetical protein